MDFGKMPVYFIENRGQMDERVAYYVQGKDKSLYFTESGVTFVLNEKAPDRPAGKSENFGEKPRSQANGQLKRHVVKLDFVGANADVSLSGEEKTEAVISYFKGNPEDWHAGLPTYGRIVYRNLWPGIDLAYSGTSDKLKYEFVIQPGADPASIRLAYSGASAVEVNGDGRLEITTPQGDFQDDVPAAYQEAAADRTAVPVGYELSAAKDGGYEYQFRLGEYDRNRPLIIDPAILIYCGYIGGSAFDYGYGIAVDESGNAYVTGSTFSTEATFPKTVGPDLTQRGGEDAFVAKINSSGTGLVYCGYIGGSDDDRGYGIAVDGSGNAYVTGYTYSSEATFPKRDGPDLTYNGGGDAFVAKIKPSGTGLDYCGYIGGSGTDYGYGIAVGGSGTAYVTGSTSSTATTFPEAVGPDLKFNGWEDAFVARVNASGSGLVYCGYIGGEDQDQGRAIAVDADGNAYVTGLTYSSQATFPVLFGSDVTYNGSGDAFVAKVKASGAGLDYCGYIGGSGLDFGYGIAVNGSGNAYVTGSTYSTEATFCETGGPDVIYNGNGDAFVAKLKASGAGLDYCGYIGGSGLDSGYGIAVDGAGNAYVAGTTQSTEDSFPETVGPDLTYNEGKGGDAFVAKVNSSGSHLDYCGYIGGSATDVGCGIAVDGTGNAYVIGYTYSVAETFPEKVGPDLIHNGGVDAFVAKISEVVTLPSIGLSRQTLNFGAMAAGVVSTKSQSVVVSNTGGGTLVWTASSDKSWLTMTPASGSGTAVIQVGVNPAGLAVGPYTGTITVSDPDAANSPQTITVTFVVLAAGTNAIPFGSFDTPTHGTVGVTGAIPVTGWVLDDVEVVKVEILRDNVAGEAPGQWAIGDAIFVEGARPDIETTLPGYPLNYRAGWGYMLLTNMLPGQGNGTFKLYAYATDKEGNRMLLGTKTITCDNAHGLKPFGAIDSPAQGGDASGSSYWNFGWVLTPLTKTVPKNGSTILVYVDGAYVGNLGTAPNVYNQYRADVSEAFPGLNNTGAPGVGGPVGAFFLNTATYANGVHTIQWVATDDAGAADGIGSRYFNIINTGTTANSVMENEKLSHREERSDAAIPTKEKGHCEPLGVAITHLDSILNLPPSFAPLDVKRGYNLASPAETIIPDNFGIVRIEMREVERLEISFDPNNPPTPPFRKGGEETMDVRKEGEYVRYAGFQIVGDELRPLPIGSTLDSATGTFSWMPGPGFVGVYDLIFLQTDGFGIIRRIPIKVTIGPKFSRH